MESERSTPSQINELKALTMPRVWPISGGTLFRHQIVVRRTARWYLRVDTFRTIRLSAHPSNRSPSRSTCQLSKLFAGLFNLAMQIERERFLRAGYYERTPERRGYANGAKAKKIDTPAGTVTLQVPKTADHDEPFYPQALERGRRSCRAVMLAVAEMYIKGVSTRDVEAVMREFGLESLSSTQVSRAAKLLDEELAAWRNRPLGEIRYLILDARYEKVREAGVVRDAAVLSAIGIGPDQRRRVLGVSCAISEAEVHWRAFLESLVKRGMRGVAYIVSDDHPGLGAARKAVLGGATWQRCHYHLAQNAIHHAPNLAVRKAIGKQLRRIWDAPDIKAAEAELAHLVESYRQSATTQASGRRTFRA